MWCFRLSHNIYKITILGFCIIRFPYSQFDKVHASMLSSTLIHFGFLFTYCYHRPNRNTACNVQKNTLKGWPKTDPNITPVIDFQGFIYILADGHFWQRNELLSFFFWRGRPLKDVINFYKIKLSLPCEKKLV